MFKDVSFNTTAMSLGTVSEHKKRIPTAIVISDPNSQAKIFTFRDVFTPAASNGTASPTAVTKTFFHIQSPGGGVTLDYGEKVLAGIELFGAVDVSSNVADNSGNIHFAYEEV